MKACLLLLMLGTQDSVEDQIDAFLAEFQAAAEGEEAMALLIAQLDALGASGTTPIARRLAEDLRDGMLSAYGPAFLDALEGRPEAIAPLRDAFQDEATSVAGRIELANALSQLEDNGTWLDALRAIADDPGVEEGDRRRATDVLQSAVPFGAEQPRAVLVEEAGPTPRPGPRRGPSEKKDDTSPATGSMIIAAGLVAGIVLLLALKRKG